MYTFLLRKADKYSITFQDVDKWRVKGEIESLLTVNL